MQIDKPGILLNYFFNLCSMNDTRWLHGCLEVWSLWASRHAFGPLFCAVFHITLLHHSGWSANHFRSWCESGPTFLKSLGLALSLPYIPNLLPDLGFQLQITNSSFE